MRKEKVSIQLLVSEPSFTIGSNVRGNDRPKWQRTTGNIIPFPVVVLERKSHFNGGKVRTRNIALYSYMT